MDIYIILKKLALIVLWGFLIAFFALMGNDVDLMTGETEIYAVCRGIAYVAAIIMIADIVEFVIYCRKAAKRTKQAREQEQEEINKNSRK